MLSLSNFQFHREGPHRLGETRPATMYPWFWFHGCPYPFRALDCAADGSSNAASAFSIANRNAFLVGELVLESAFQRYIPRSDGVSSALFALPVYAHRKLWFLLCNLSIARGCALEEREKERAILICSCVCNRVLASGSRTGAVCTFRRHTFSALPVVRAHLHRRHPRDPAAQGKILVQICALEIGSRGSLQRKKRWRRVQKKAFSHLSVGRSEGEQTVSMVEKRLLRGLALHVLQSSQCLIIRARCIPRSVVRERGTIGGEWASRSE